MNTKFSITNKKKYIKKSLLVMFIASFLQNKTKQNKTVKNKKKALLLLDQCTILEYK